MAISSSSNPVSVSSGANLSPTARRTALTVVTSIFFMWGFLTCLNDILIPQLKSVFDLTYVEALLIQFTFFGAYFLVSLPAGKIVASLGYKRGMVVGLLISGAGAALFYPAAGSLSYPLFLGALFVLASGITVLQVAANPYISVLGDPQTASSRLNLAQAFNSLGTTLAPLFGGWLILTEVSKTITTDKAAEAATVQIPYLGLALALIVLAVIIASLKLPTIAAVEGDADHALAGMFKIRHLVLGAVAIFVYVGAEVSIGSILINFLGEPYIMGFSKQEAAPYVAYYWGAAMVGRFIGSALLQKIPANKLLAINASIAVLLLGVALLTKGSLAMWSVLIIGLFNSIMFPNIFTLGIDGLGHRTSRGSSLLIMAIVGGAFIPLLMGAVADHINIHSSLLIPAICYLYIIFYGLSGYKHAPDFVRS